MRRIHLSLLQTFGGMSDYSTHPRYLRSEQHYTPIILVEVVVSMKWVLSEDSYVRKVAKIQHNMFCFESIVMRCPFM